MTENWRNNFKSDKRLILSTASKDAIPNANIVISLGFVEDKLLIADCLMKTTIDNLKSNPKICVISGYYKIKGSVHIFSTGKYFNLCVSRSAKISSDKVKNAILVEVEAVFDLNNASAIS